MDAEVTPEPEDGEREAILAALAREGGGAPDVGETAWRKAGLDEAAGAWSP
ncbi:MAG: hypothetical protein MSC30_15855 [Gaiellaceae bacterium MAG52_C11]|nr:hypothetical protein [Candidatus Gaiellasilicea maunaloa]